MEKAVMEGKGDDFREKEEDPHLLGAT